jgi:hypothetical protein
MPEIKKQFTGGKMNKDVDERLVPTGEYRDAMNIQVSTSEGSDVGTIQNVLGNIPGCADFNSAIGDDAFTVGSISDEKNDTLYWLIAGRTEENLILPLSVGESVSLKDMIMSYNSSTGCTPVFVDKWKFCTGIDPNSSYYGSLTSYIVLDDTSLYSNITQGMFATGYDGPNIVWGPTLVNDVGLLTTIPVNYQSETTTAMVNSTPITDTAWINVRTFYELGCTGGPPNYNINRKNPCSPNQSQVSSTNIPPNTYGAQLWIHPSDWNPNIVVGSKVSATNVTNGYSMLSTAPPGAEITAVNSHALCKNTNHPGTASGNMSGCINAYVLDIEPFIISGTPSSPYAGTNPLAFTPSYSPPVFDSEYNSYKSFSGTITPPPYPVYTPTDVIYIATNSDQWLDEIYNIFYDASGVLITGAFLQINNNVGAGSSWPPNSCIDPSTVSAPIAGIYDDTFNIIDCQTGLPQNALNLNPTGRPLTFSTLPVFGTEAVILNDSINMDGVDTVCFESDRVLNFDKDRLITGVNIIDDMLLWTDNFSEPKKINIGRSKSGTDIAGDTHTAVVNLDVGHSLTNWYQPIREEHITVIKKSPKSALSLQLEVGRDTSLNYTGITSIGAPTSITAPPTISDFSSIAIGDTISFNINSDYTFNSTFALAWQPDQFVLLTEAPDISNLPGIPLANWTIRGRILSQASNNFDSANGLPVNVTIEIIGLNGVPDDPDPSVGYLNYIVELENTEPSIFADKFPRFSYRYKYSDNEYSTFAPWSEVAFLPTTFDYDPKKGWNKAMINSLRFIKISGFRPSVYGLPTGKDVIEVDILYKEDSSPNVYLVETISPIDILQSGLSTIPWYSDEYIIDSETIKSTIASNQLLRPWDNVPKKALAQEVSGNRVIYGNYEQNYDLKVGGLKYKPDFTNSLVAWGGVSAGSPQKSIKSLRDYKLGVVFTDKYGRETPVVISENGGFKVDKQQSINANRLTVGLTGQPPAEMAYYKFYVKETSTEYYSIAMDRWYAAEDGNIWLAFPSSDRNKVDLDTSLYFKKGNDGDNNVIENSTRYKILALENEAPEWIKTKRVRIGTVNHNVSGNSQIFGVTGSTTTNAPTVGGISFTMDYGDSTSNQNFISTTLSHMEDIKEDIYVQFVRAGDRSAQYKVSEITSDRIAATATADGIPEHYFVTLDKAFEEDINFIFDFPASPNEILDDTRIIFTKAVIENKPQFDGRFFAKIENDGKIQTMINEDSLGFNYITSSFMKVYVLDDDHGSGRNDFDVSAHAWTVGGLAYGGNDMIRQNYCWVVVNGCSTNLANYLAPVDQNSYAGQLDNPNGYNFNALFARKAYFQDVWGTSTNGLNAANNLGKPGVWFIDRSTRLYTVPSTGCNSNSLSWPNTSNMNHMSPSCNNPYWSDWGVASCGAPYPDHTGITNYSDTSNVKISFGPIWHSGLIDQSIIFSGGSGGWYTTSTMTDFFGIGTTNSLYNDSITSKFVSNLNAGSMFKWKEDPTETIYTIEDQTACKNFCRFGRYSSGKHNGQSNHNFSGTEHFEDPSSYTKQWSFNVNKSMAGWDPAGPVGTYMTNGLHLGDATGPARHTKTTTVDLLPGSVILNLLDTNGLKPGMSAMHADLPLNCKIVSVLPSSVTLSTGPLLQINVNSTVDFGFTIRIVGGSIYANTVGSGAVGTNPQENYIIVDNIETECSNSNNLKPIYSLHKGMALAEYNLDTLPNNGGTEASTTYTAIIKHIHPQDSSGNFKIDLAGYWTPLQGGQDWDDGSAGFLINERMLFKQITMNGASNYTEHNTDKSLQHNPLPLINGPAGAVGAVGYTMEFLDVVDQYSDGGYLPEDPFVWETEPKDNTELDIYYEISENNPIVLNPDTINIAIPIGSKVASIAGAGGISDNTYVSSVGGINGNQIKISELAWVGPGNALDGTLPLISGSTLEITKPNGVVLSVEIQNVVQMPTPPFTVSRIFELDPSLFNSEYKLNWHNCWSFGNGVESNRIKDTFNSPFIGHGVKVSTTSDDYKKEHRKSGLIYSGLYNSTSGINNLNQFIQAEKITKDVNPTYGSIQKLYAGWGQGGDLIALCEDRVLKILANKDALYNADGNSNITSTNNVLGTATPFAGNYGISKNPESFASESFRAYFTDKVRGAVIRLSMDGLTAISDRGMKDWFRDNLKLNNKLVGSYDDKKDEYNITLQQTTEQTPKTVSFREDVRGWVSFKSFVPENAISCSNEYYTFLDGKLWRHHEENVFRNTFYNITVDTSFTAILNDVPGSVKSFNTINYEGSQSRVVQNLLDNEYYNLTLAPSGSGFSKDGWYVDSIFTDMESGVVDEFIEKEGKWFNYIKGENILHTLNNNIIINPDGNSTFDQASFAIQGLGITTGVVTSVLIYGCTDATAFNYNAAANTDDGSCIPYTYGCTDPTAYNYSPTVNISDNSCVWLGCTQSSCNATNSTTFPANAYNIVDDGSCITAVYGCTIWGSLNYNATANVNQVSCTDTTNPCVAIVNGCMISNADNYNLLANTDNGTCTWAGCTNPLATNYDPLAPVNSTVAQSYNPSSSIYGIQDEDSIYCTGGGCMDQTATNYDSTATYSVANSCLYCDWSSNGGYNGIPITTSVLNTTGGFGNGQIAIATNSLAPYQPFTYYVYSGNTANNANLIATITSVNNQTLNGISAAGSHLVSNLPAGDYVVKISGNPANAANACEYTSPVTTIGSSVVNIVGCMDLTACNYDAAANVDQGCQWTSCAGCMDASANGNPAGIGAWGLQSNSLTPCYIGGTFTPGVCTIACGDGNSSHEFW